VKERNRHTQNTKQDNLYHLINVDGNKIVIMTKISYNLGAPDINNSILHLFVYVMSSSASGQLHSQHEHIQQHRTQQK
jgi:hypothetical protein